MTRPILLKLGGRVLEEIGPGCALAGEIAALASGGAALCIVHGGGSQVSSLGRRLGAEPVIVGGRRVTDEPALQALIMAVAGGINTRLVASLCAMGVRAVGLTGADASMITAVRRPPRKVTDPVTGKSSMVDFGHVGDIVAVDPLPARALVAAGMVPVVACLAADAQGQLLNVNADTIAAALAGALEAGTLILASDVEGIMTAQGERIPAADAREVGEMIGAGVISGGMALKAEAGLAALRQGVCRVMIVDGRRRGSLGGSPGSTQQGTELRG